MKTPSERVRAIGLHVVKVSITRIWSKQAGKTPESTMNQVLETVGMSLSHYQNCAPAALLIQWQKQFGRHGLPWMIKDAYCRWVSEIMLQQTQVAVVRDYYLRFMKAFPTIESLAAASEQDVMRLWAGLGYYTRARNLHACARKVLECHGGRLPKTVAELESLPGIGRSTAGAIASFAYDVSAPILDGNVKRVFTRLVRYEGAVGVASTEKDLWQLAHAWVPEKEAGTYNQALMDLGATVCTRTQPKCERCPLKGLCAAYAVGDAHRFPIRRPKKNKPTKHAIMMLWYSSAGVWLEQRTGKGVWRGLTSLPEVTEPFGEPFLTFSHVFSHYELKANVFLKWVDQTTYPTPKGRWVNLQELDRVALPAPIEKVLRLHAEVLFSASRPRDDA